MELDRPPTHQEEALIEHLIKKSSWHIPNDWKKDLLVRPMNDGEMGGLYIFPKGKTKVNRLMGQIISEVQFKDADNVDVIASLYVDSHGELFELDMWKTDFSRLIKFPTIY